MLRLDVEEIEEMTYSQPYSYIKVELFNKNELSQEGSYIIFDDVKDLMIYLSAVKRDIELCLYERIEDNKIVHIVVIY